MRKKSELKVTHGGKIKLEWDNNHTASVDILIEYKNMKYVLEYDGSYWHRDKIAKDLSKTKALIRDGYKVIRIREAPLLFLDKTDGLLQISYKYKTDLLVPFREILKFIKEN